jgi:protease II
VQRLDPNRYPNPLQCVQRRVPGREYFVEHAANMFFIVSNASGPNYALYLCPDPNPNTHSHPNPTPNPLPHPDQWQLLVPHSLDVKLEDVDVFRHHVP